MREKLKNNTGITSMTLVMAIIILLILIGLAMAFLGNDKGEETTNTAEQEENEVLDNFENIIGTNQPTAVFIISSIISSFKTFLFIS